ncbi:MAG: DUF1566 domain-containing protein [Deferribacterales bacterium]
MRKLLMCVLGISFSILLTACGGEDDAVYKNAEFKLTKTGITSSYINYDDGYYRKGEDSQFVRDAADGVVKDDLNGFMWQDSSNTSNVKYTWVGAVGYCDNLVYAGYSDWRLPEIDEFESALDYGLHSLAGAFENLSSSWTATESVDNTAWVYTGAGTARFQFMNMAGLSDTIAAKTTEMPARCVRKGNDVDISYTRISSSEIVYSDETGLMWQDNADAASENILFADAVNYCENLDLGGYSDWRLPNVRELKSILDAENTGMYGVFVNDGMENYWSSSVQDTSVAEPGAVTVDFSGNTILMPTSVSGNDTDNDWFYNEFVIGASAQNVTYFFSTFPVEGNVTALNAFTTTVPSAKCVRDN